MADLRLIPVKIPGGVLVNPKKMARALENALDGAALGAKVDFDTTTQTWKHRPTFLIKGKVGERRVYTTDVIYSYVSGGTKVRYATMTSNFRPKTRYRWIGSNRGRGGLRYVSRKVPRPGIKAREFPEAVVEKWEKQLPTILQRAVDAEV